MNHYERVAGIIRYLDEHRLEQPDLETLARESGLSASHFHRLFSAWAAITPKDFLQCLTVSHAKQLLKDGANILEASFEAGLSGPGRLHDLCVTLEAASPGEIKNGGKGWILRAGFAETPFGKALLAEGPRGLCHLSFGESDHEAWNALRENWPQADLQRDDVAASRLAKKVFGSRKHSTPHLKTYVQGTAFQVRVWRALLQIPPGTLTSYGQLASAIGHPRAARAVGTAVGQNPLAFLIPCHRVIRETGSNRKLPVESDSQAGDDRVGKRFARKIKRQPVSRSI